MLTGLTDGVGWFRTAGYHDSRMKALGWLASMAVFVFLTNRCGKSIGKREWEQSVAYFLLALGTILYLVKITPAF